MSNIEKKPCFGNFGSEANCNLYDCGDRCFAMGGTATNLARMPEEAKKAIINEERQHSIYQEAIVMFGGHYIAVLKQLIANNQSKG